jgi:Galactose oxidase, central domain/Kelch motif
MEILVKNLWLVLAIGSPLVLAACGGGGIKTPPPQEQVKIISSPPTSGTVNVNYRGFTPTATGGTPPYNWSWTPSPGSTLPPGLLMSNSGIYGAPMTAGTYNVVIAAKDSASPPNQGSANFSIKIVDEPSVQIVAFPPPPAASLALPYYSRITALGGQKPLTWSEMGPLPPGLSLSSDNFGGILSGIPTTTGTFPITLMVTDAAGQSAPSQDFTILVAQQGFKVASNLATQRRFHNATLLQDGRVLVTGGTDQYGTSLSSTELYDATARTFSTPATMTGARGCHTATQLNDGRVLIAGGFDSTGGGSLVTTELFDASTSSFASTANMSVARACPTATLLKDGRVLIIGGIDTTGAPLVTAELFDPTTGSFSSAGPMTTSRAFHTATLLSDGRVLVAGGVDALSADLMNPNIHPISSAELFDPATGRFSATGGMAWTRFSHTATLLSNGKVVIAGGSTSGFFAGEPSLSSAEIFDPATGKFVDTGMMTVARSDHTATRLDDGTVLIAGGDPENIMNLVIGVSIGSFPSPLNSAELFNPTTGTFTETGGLGMARENHTSTLLNDGTVLVTGGFWYAPAAETYQ